MIIEANKTTLPNYSLSTDNRFLPPWEDDSKKYKFKLGEPIKLDLPIIMQALHERRAFYTKGIDYLKSMPSKYILRKGSEQFIVVPIFHGSVSIGYICGDEFEEGFQISNDLLEAFTSFGRLSGELLVTKNPGSKNCPLSKHELEVMQHIALGESVKENADSIQISDLTVNQYIKSAIKKLQAQNRVEAIVKLCKLGLI